MNPLRIATQGLLAVAGQLSVASQGFQPLGSGFAHSGGSSRRGRDTRRDRLREDDELILLMFAQAVASGAIH